MDIDSEGQENSANELRLNRSEVEEEEEIYLALFQKSIRQNRTHLHTGPDSK